MAKKTRYQFNCGAVQRKDTFRFWKKMFFEHNTIHVMGGPQGSKWKIWEVFEKNELTKARKCYSSIFPILRKG